MNPNNFSRSPGAVPPPTHEQVAALAHEIWRERGSPEGSDVDIWLEAERQLNGGPVNASGVRDPIPADADHIDPDTDPALNQSIDREISSIGGRGNGSRSATSLNPENL